jgi:hypothetical protein
METLYKKIGFFAFVLVFSPTICRAFQAIESGEVRMNFDEWIKFSRLSARDWVSENIYREGKVVNVNNINGEIKMSFSVEREQKINSKRKKPVRNFRYSVGGTAHETKFTIIGDTIHFHGYKYWNDCKIIELKKDKLVLEQNYQSTIVQWNMIPHRKKNAAKSNVYDFKRENLRLRNSKNRNK